MIKIGNAYVRENRIDAIRVDSDFDRVHVFLSSGQVVVEDADVESLERMLIETGFLDTDSGTDIFAFAPGENQELLLAYEDDFLFAAKDKNGQVFAYKRKPDKRGAEWAITGNELEYRRLHGDFDCLSFEDDEPLDLVELFSFRDAGEDE